MFRTFFVLAIALSLTACGGSEEVAEVEKQGKIFEESEDAPGDGTAAETELSYLADFVGKTPADAGIWTTEPLNARLRALLGDAHPTFLENIQVVGPVAEEERNNYLMGNKAHQGGIDSAVLVADTVNNNLKVWLLRGGSISEFVEKDQFVKLPNEAVMYIANWTPGS